jgi:hypothetical protein
MPTRDLYMAQRPPAQRFSKAAPGDTQPQIDVRRPRPAQRVGALDSGIARDIEKLAALGGLAAVCAAVDLFGRRSGFEIEVRDHFRKCAEEADPAALTLIAGAL